MLVAIEIIIKVIQFFFGACIFSFLNVVIDRLPRQESVVRGRSHCTKCGRELTALELVPCISYICLGGKCKTCGVKIPPRDFIVEIIGGAAFIGCGTYFGCGNSGIISLRGAVIFAYLGILLVVALIDQDTQMIYDRFHVMVLALAIAAIWLFPEHGIRSRLLGTVVIAVPMLVISLLIPGAFGGGDIKLMAVSGLFLGAAPTVCAMFIGLVTGGGYGAYMLISKKLDRKDHFAFGPFLAFGLAVAVFAGDRIAEWYLGML
ncbi:prepilin peptidase [Eubacterium ramulus]|uniref:prepilin peptidase n=1 Tax=Eubacterium ramulus TaxID=39490 RepID=UPI00307B81B9